MPNNIGNIVGKAGADTLKPKKMNIIDVSHWQGKINWAAVAAQTNPFKIDGAIIKSSTGVV